jgi:hypothetical protein
MLDLLPLNGAARERLTQRDFPTTLSDRRLGLSDDPVVAQLVHRALSYAVMDPIDRSGMAIVRNLGRVLRYYAVVQLDDESAPPFAQLAETPLSGASQARNLLGIGFDDEHEAWMLIKDAKTEDQRTCSIELLSLYVPAPLWRVFEHIILEGREAYRERMTAVLSKVAALSPERSNHKRSDDALLSPGWINSLRARAANMVGLLFDLSADPRFAEVLCAGGWNTRKVSGGELGGDKRAVTRGANADSGNVTDTAAPPLRLVRLRFAELDYAAEKALGREPGDDEVKLINKLPEAKLLTSTLEKLLRDRLLVLWLPRFAQRAGALPYLSEVCLDFKHTFLDGEVGPGVLVFDPKTPNSAHWRWRPFEPELVPYIKAYLAIKRRRAELLDEQTADHIAVPDDARRLINRSKRGVVETTSPALFRVPRTLRPLSPVGLNKLCTARGGQIRPLIPRPDGSLRGFNPHSFRHLYRGLVSSEAAKRLYDMHGQDAERRDVCGRMGLDHGLTGLDALYKDDNSDLGREQGTRLGGRSVFEQLLTPLGLRTHRDGETYRRVLTARDSAEQELRRIEEDFERHSERIEREGRDVPASAIVPLLRRQAQTARLARELAEHERTIMGIEGGHEDYLVTVADHIPHSEIPRVDLVHIKREHRQAVPQGRVRSLRQDHNWYTAEQLVELKFAASATVRGWMKNAVEGQPVPRKAPWDTSDNPVFVFTGDSRRRAVYAEAVRFLTQEQRDMGAAMLADERPEGWEHLQKMVPDPRPSAHRSHLRAA